MADDLRDDLLALVDRLVATSVRHKLPGRALIRQPAVLNARDYIVLLNEAALLAQSLDPDARTAAYEICTHCLNLSRGTTGTLVRAVEFVMARLGNFPGRDLLRLRYKQRLENALQIPNPLALEALGHEHENTVQSVIGESLRLTDFQFDFFDATRANSSVSVSAPTSAGKSFVLSLQILRRLQAIKPSSVIYVVPTRALIREVILRLRTSLQAANMTDVALRSVPQPLTSEDVPHGVVYVLTQERLLSLLHAAGSDFWMTLLIVDEAQGVRDGGRGVLLQSAIESALKLRPNAEVIFASPLINNPQYLLNLFGLEGYTPHERHSPVAQNFITVSYGATNKQNVQFSILRRSQTIVLGERILGFDFRALNQIQRRANFALAVAGERDACLVYANGASEAEETAIELAAIRQSRQVPQEVQDFITYIEEYIHPQYALLSPLKKGVGFHHGEMPASVRAGVEDLFRERKLQFVCCTGTLLQGVNLPARHLVVEKPRRGNGQPMEPADFLNLAGRAGRLGREFHGNVWCIRPEYWQSQPQDRTELPNVVSAFESLMNDGGTFIQRALDSTSNNDLDGAATASINRLLSEYIRGNREPDFHLTSEADEQLKKTFDVLRSLPLTLTTEIFELNGGILPTRIEALYQFLKNEDTLDEWLPLAPFEKGFYARLRKIFELLHREIHGKTTLDYGFDAWLAFRWVHQDTLQQIIDSSVKWKVSQGLPLDVPNTIRKIIRQIERMLRYQWVRSLRAFNDVLKVELRSREMNEQADSLRPLYLYLEYGAYDRPILSLISLGFSRTASLVLNRLIKFPATASPEECRTILLRSNLVQLGVPAVIRREARALLGGSD